MLMRPSTTCAALLALLVTGGLLTSSQAFANGRMLRWNECNDMGGVRAKDFACVSNEGFSDLVASFYVFGDPPIEGVTGLVARLEIGGGDRCSPFGTLEGPDFDPLPSYWRLQQGGCRSGEGVVSFSFTGTLQCRNPWSAGPPISPQVSITYPNQPGVTRRVRIDISAGWPEQGLIASQEYYAFRLRVNHALGTGDGACEGCCQPMTAHLETMYLTRSNGSTIGLAADSPAAVWNETGCQATPTRSTTWGLIKGLYR